MSINVEIFPLQRYLFLSSVPISPSSISVRVGETGLIFQKDFVYRKSSNYIEILKPFTNAELSSTLRVEYRYSLDQFDPSIAGKANNIFEIDRSTFDPPNSLLYSDSDQIRNYRGEYEYLAEYVSPFDFLAESVGIEKAVIKNIGEIPVLGFIRPSIPIFKCEFRPPPGIDFDLFSRDLPIPSINYDILLPTFLTPPSALTGIPLLTSFPATGNYITASMPVVTSMFANSGMYFLIEREISATIAEVQLAATTIPLPATTESLLPDATATVICAINLQEVVESIISNLSSLTFFIPPEPPPLPVISLQTSGTRPSTDKYMNIFEALTPYRIIQDRIIYTPGDVNYTLIGTTRANRAHRGTGNGVWRFSQNGGIGAVNRPKIGTLQYENSDGSLTITTVNIISNFVRVSREGRAVYRFDSFAIPGIQSPISATITITQPAAQTIIVPSLNIDHIIEDSENNVYAEWNVERDSITENVTQFYLTIGSLTS